MRPETVAQIEAVAHKQADQFIAAYVPRTLHASAAVDAFSSWMIGGAAAAAAFAVHDFEKLERTLGRSAMRESLLGLCVIVLVGAMQKGLGQMVSAERHAIESAQATLQSLAEVREQGAKELPPGLPDSAFPSVFEPALAARLNMQLVSHVPWPVRRLAKRRIQMLKGKPLGVYLLALNHHGWQSVLTFLQVILLALLIARVGIALW